MNDHVARPMRSLAYLLDEQAGNLEFLVPRLNIDRNALQCLGGTAALLREAAIAIRAQQDAINRLPAKDVR